jgi:O-antigen/teichoic acid export membrane protein
MARVAHIKDTFKHALIFGSAGLIGKVVGFVMLPLYAHHLGDEGYGVIVPARVVWTRFCNSGGFSHGISLTGFEG